MLNFKSDIQVTVMITFYNQKESIDRTLSSVINQKTNFKFEVLIGDDGSTDGSYERLVEWAIKFPTIIKLFRMPRDININYEPIVRASNNRHKLLSNAKGKYITFLDGDDYYTNEKKLQIQTDILNSNPDLSGCFHPFKMVWEDNLEEDKLCGSLSTSCFTMSFNAYWFSTWIPSECFLFKNSYKGIENLINNNYFDDNLITLYFIKLGKIAFYPVSMVNYVQHKKSSWNARSEIDKAFVNMNFYQEANNIIPKLKWLTTLRLQSVFSTFYKHRNDDIFLIPEQYAELKNKFVDDTLKFRDTTILFKFIYYFRYFILCHLGKFTKVLNKIVILYVKNFKSFNVTLTEHKT